MDRTEGGNFLDFIKQVFAPLVSLFYVLTVILQFKDKINQIGLQLFALAIFILAVLWTIYVWRNYKTKTYSKLIRYGAIIASIIVLVPLVIVIIPHSAPIIKFSFTNKSDKVVLLRKYHQYLIHNMEPNGFTDIYASGILTLKSINNTEIKQGETKYYECDFANKNQIEEYISNGNYFISISVNFTDSIDSRINSDYLLLLNSENLKKIPFSITYLK